MKPVFWLVLLLILARSMESQTITPVISICGLKCRGEFTVRNDSVKPMIVTITPYSFHMVAGHPVLIPVVNGTDVQLDQTSARLSPKGEHTFSYRLLCQNEPCMTQFLAGFAGGKADSGVQVMLRLPHVVYSCKQQKDCRQRALGTK
jgi:hypothetical protein